MMHSTPKLKSSYIRQWKIKVLSSKVKAILHQTDIFFTIWQPMSAYVLCCPFSSFCPTSAVFTQVYSKDVKPMLQLQRLLLRQLVEYLGEQDKCIDPSDPSLSLRLPNELVRSKFVSFNGWKNQYGSLLQRVREAIPAQTESTAAVAW
jgi:hypothetical protein